MRRDVAGHRQAGRLRAADEVQAAPRREVREVEPGARHVAQDVGEDREVARDGHLLGRGRPAAQTEDRRDEPVVRLGALGQAEVLGDGRRSAARARPRRPARPAGSARTGPAPRRRRTRPRPHRPARRARPAAPLPARPSPRRARAARPASREATRGGPDPARTPGSSRARRRVRHRADRREAAVRRRRQPRRDRLGVLVAGLAQVRVEVDEAGRDDDPAGVDAVGVGAVQPGDRLEDPVADDDLARALAARRRVDQPGAADLEIRAFVRSRGLGPGRVRAGEQVQDRHPDRDTVRDLVRDDRLGAGRDVGGDLHALVHRARVHDERAGLGQRETLARSARSGRRTRAATAAGPTPSARAGSAGP